MLRGGPTVSFQGDPDECLDDDVFTVNVVNVPNFHINKGEVDRVQGQGDRSRSTAPAAGRS